MLLAGDYGDRALMRSVLEELRNSRDANKPHIVFLRKWSGIPEIAHIPQDMRSDELGGMLALMYDRALRHWADSAFMDPTGFGGVNACYTYSVKMNDGAAGIPHPRYATRVAEMIGWGPFKDGGVLIRDRITNRVVYVTTQPRMYGMSFQIYDHDTVIRLIRDGAINT